MPRKLVPQATFLALTLFGASIIGGLWCLSYAVSWDKLKAVADAGGMPISEIARQYWGRWAVLVPITAISAALGISIVTAVGASRVLYSMGRGGLAPATLGELHPTYQVPWKAMHVIFGSSGFLGGCRDGRGARAVQRVCLVGHGDHLLRDDDVPHGQCRQPRAFQGAGVRISQWLFASRGGAGGGDRRWTG